MKNRRMLRLLSLCAALLLCHGAISASAASLSPMEKEGLYYTQRIPQAGISVYIPVGVSSNVLMDTEDGFAVNLSLPVAPDTAFVFFALRNDTLEGKDVAALDEAGMQALVRTISEFPEMVEWELVDGVLPGEPVVLMRETRPGLYCEHLVTLRGPWVFNCMTGVMGENPELGEIARINQRDILAMALDEENLNARFQEYAFPESSITLSVPESTHMMLLGDEPNFKWLVVAQPGTDLIAVSVYAYWDEAFQAGDVTTLDAGTLEKLMRHATQSGYQKDSVRQEDIGGMPVMAYASDGPGEPVQHLVGLREGWGFNVMLPGYDSIDRVWAAEAQRAVMAQLLTGEGSLPEMPAEENARTLLLGDTLGIPLGQRFLMLALPDGYTYRIDRDTDAYRQITLVEQSPDSKKIELTFERDTFAGGTSDFLDMADEEEALAVANDFAETMMAESGLQIDSSYMAVGPWGPPMVTLAGEDMAFLLSFTMVGDYMTQIYWMPSETGRTFTAEEVEAFLQGVSVSR